LYFSNTSSGVKHSLLDCYWYLNISTFNVRILRPISQLSKLVASVETNNIDFLLSMGIAPQRLPHATVRQTLAMNKMS